MRDIGFEGIKLIGMPLEPVDTNMIFRRETFEEGGQENRIRIALPADTKQKHTIYGAAAVDE